jgi:hypothetical protein
MFSAERRMINGRLANAEEVLGSCWNLTQDALKTELHSQGYKAAVTITRTADEVAYDAGDAIGQDAGTAQVETATAVGTITPGTAQVETATVVGTVTAGVSQVETATVVGTITAGTAQVETATVVGTITGAGTAKVEVTAAAIPGSPITLNVAVAEADDDAAVAAKIRAVMQAVDAITDYYTPGGEGSAITLTRVTGAANDATLNIAIDNGTCTGLTAAPESVDTTAGVAPGTGNALVTITGLFIGGSPLQVLVPVVGGDDDATVAGKIRTALAAQPNVTANFTPGGEGAAVSLTKTVPVADDETLNIAIDNGTCTGLTAAPESVDTTAGVAPGTGTASVIVTGAFGAVNLAVPVTGGDDDATVAGKIRTALAANATIAASFTAGGAAAAVALTRKVAAANDATLNIAIDNGTCTGLTAAPESVDTTAGVAPGTGNAKVTVTGAAIAGSPLELLVPVTAGDEAATWAGKVRTALAANAAVTAHYTPGGEGADITLTRKDRAANDATLNIALDNGTCTGITAAAESTATTAGSATSTNKGSAVLELTDIGPAGGSVFVTSVPLRIDVDGVPTGMTTFRLHLFDAAPAATLDNDACDLATDADRAKYLGFVTLSAPVDLGSTLYSQNDNIDKQVSLAPGSTTLWAKLQTVGGCTLPASAKLHLAVNTMAA